MNNSNYELAFYLFIVTPLENKKIVVVLLKIAVLVS